MHNTFDIMHNTFDIVLTCAYTYIMDILQVSMGCINVPFTFTYHGFDRKLFLYQFLFFLQKEIESDESRKKYCSCRS